MNFRSSAECENRSIESLKRYQLPNYFKKIGLILAILSFLSFFISEKGSDPRLVGKYLLLLSLLIISVSKEKFEDELLIKLRMQSYTIAFIAAVFFALTMPFFDYAIDYLFEINPANFKSNSDFKVLWILLLIQIAYFEQLKLAHK